MKPSAGMSWEEVGFLQRSLPTGASEIGKLIITHGKKSLATHWEVRWSKK
jgi:hypothetical protein